MILNLLQSARLQFAASVTNKGAKTAIHDFSESVHNLKGTYTISPNYVYSDSIALYNATLERFRALGAPDNLAFIREMSKIPLQSVPAHEKMHKSQLLAHFFIRQAGVVVRCFEVLPKDVQAIAKHSLPTPPEILKGLRDAHDNTLRHAIELS